MSEYLRSVWRSKQLRAYPVKKHKNRILASHNIISVILTHPSLFLRRKPDFSVPYFLLPCGWWMLYPLPEFFLFRYSWDTNQDLGLYIKAFEPALKIMKI